MSQVQLDTCSTRPESTEDAECFACGCHKHNENNKTCQFYLCFSVGICGQKVPGFASYQLGTRLEKENKLYASSPKLVYNVPTQCLKSYVKIAAYACT